MVIKIIGPDVAAMGSHGGTHSDANGLSRRSRIPRRGPHTEYLNELIANVFFRGMHIHTPYYCAGLGT